MLEGPAEAMTGGMHALSMALGGFGAKRLFFGGWPSSGLVDGPEELPVGGGYGLPTRLLGGERVDGPDPSESTMAGMSVLPMAFVVFGGGRFDFFAGFAASRLAWVDDSVFALFLLYSNGQNYFTERG
jgi:hypothetical protein